MQSSAAIGPECDRYRLRLNYRFFQLSDNSISSNHHCKRLSVVRWVKSRAPSVSNTPSVNNAVSD
ncbi:hypothetical protein [Nostoc sp. ATCC 53789]|uniref:hypothetical protein n=1 Tax=unclassified Nostoc TaxID=2593658 RepID=UPI0011BFBEA8|nr:hypothetical protein [Nostoc sp. ATCC 53789]QHG14981.1 hypothetical protein GJB62_02590 [Nostoc sp. ATCC 53789]